MCICQRVAQSRYNRYIPGRKGREPAGWKGNVFNTFNQLLTCRIDIYSPFRPLSLSSIPIRSVALAATLALHTSNSKRYYIKVCRNCLVVSRSPPCRSKFFGFCMDSWMARTGAPFIWLTCNLGYFFEITLFCTLMALKDFFYIFWGRGGGVG